jgi:hypothetical protein
MTMANKAKGVPAGTPFCFPEHNKSETPALLLK